MPALPSVRRVSQADADWVRDELERAWGSVYAARKGQVIDASPLDGFVASLDRVDVGLIMVRQHGLEYEVVSISTAIEAHGVGRALLSRAIQDAHSRGCRRVWLTTTNNNIRAIAFYQRLGMHLCASYRDGVSASRQVKPSIPLRDSSGVPIALSSNSSSFSRPALEGPERESAGRVYGRRDDRREGECLRYNASTMSASPSQISTW
jgi:GNAT superfamily N-acetyltransferase